MKINHNSISKSYLDNNIYGDINRASLLFVGFLLNKWIICRLEWLDKKLGINALKPLILSWYVPKYQFLKLLILCWPTLVHESFFITTPNCLDSVQVLINTFFNRALQISTCRYKIPLGIYRLLIPNIVYFWFVSRPPCLIICYFSYHYFFKELNFVKYEP